MQAMTRSLLHQGHSRTMRIHVGSKAPKLGASALLVLHGDGSGAQQMERLTKFDELADDEGFIVVYPEAVGHHWNDGREAGSFPGPQAQIDDVGFLGQVMDLLIKDYGVEAGRMFVCGFSNGGMMAQRLAKESPKVSAVASVCGLMPRNWGPEFRMQRGMGVLLIDGSSDPSMPTAGGPVRFFSGRSRGEVLGGTASGERWVQALGCQVVETETALVNSDLSDNCQPFRSTFRNPTSGSCLVRIRVEGGGHGWPGSAQYLPGALIGPVCQDFEATAEIWSFFKGLSKR